MDEAGRGSDGGYGLAPGRRARLRRLDAAHHLHPFTDNRELAARGTRILTHGEGVYVHDQDGRRLLDAFAGLWCVNLGYGRRELAEAARRQMEVLPYYNSFFGCTTEPAIELAAELARHAPLEQAMAFFTSSGSEAIDSVVRLVRHFWAVQGKPEKSHIIGRRNGYHGSTVAAASLGGMAAMHGQGGLPIPGIHHINAPYWFGEGGSLSPEAFGLQRARELEEKILELGPQRVAAFVAEPIQGAAGVFIPPSTYWPEIQRICRRHDVLLVVDEVICGFGRTGQWFGCQTFGIEPDVLVVAKGLTSGYLPLGAVLFGPRVGRVLQERGGELAHGYTYSGHPVCCAVALETLRILERERIIERCQEDTGPYLARRWHELGTHPLVGEARICGMVGALELVPDRRVRTFFPDRGRVGARCRDLALQNGLILRATWDTMLLAPPLIIRREEIDELVEKAWKALDQTQAELARG